jgi:argininosuccinate lyase
MTYNKDMQEDKEGLFDAVRTTEISLKITRRVLETMQLRAERMSQAAADGYLNATEVADYLVSRGVAFREAHEIVGKLVVRALEIGAPLERLSLAEYRSFSPRFDQDVYAVLDMTRTVARRAERGGTAPAQVRAALRRFRKKIAQAPGGRTRG